MRSHARADLALQVGVADHGGDPGHRLVLASPEKALVIVHDLGRAAASMRKGQAAGT